MNPDLGAGAGALPFLSLKHLRYLMHRYQNQLLLSDAPLAEE